MTRPDADPSRTAKGRFQGSAPDACTATFTVRAAEEEFRSGPVKDGLCGAQATSEERLKELREQVAEG